MTEKYILVTGASGFIGGEMVYLLNTQGIKTIAVDRKLNSMLPSSFPHVIFMQLDIKNLQDVSFLFENYPIQTIIHFAGEICVAESITEPQKYFEENTIGTFNLLKIMNQYHCKEFIFSSTAAVYGIPKIVPIDELHDLNPISPYGESKRFVENILESFRKAYDINYISLRYFNAAGANLAANIGERHKPETHLIPILLESLAGLREEAHIYGMDFNTPDKSAIRDYIHIKDLATAHLKALLWLRKKRQSNIFNLGSGQGTSVLEMVVKIEEITNKKIPLKFIDARKGDPPILIANIEKAHTILRWKPTHSLIEEIISDSWAFLKWRING